jgi:hypothetical protein
MFYDEDSELLKKISAKAFDLVKLRICSAGFFAVDFVHCDRSPVHALYPKFSYFLQNALSKQGPLTVRIVRNLDFFFLSAVLEIRDIFVLILIRGSVPLTNGSSFLY